MTALLVASIAISLGACLLARKRVRAELYDIVHFHGSRWRARRRLPPARVVAAIKPADDEAPRRP